MSNELSLEVPTVPVADAAQPTAAQQLSGFRGVLYLVGTRKLLLTSAALCAVVGSALGLVPAFVIARFGGLLATNQVTPDAVVSLMVWAVGAVLLRHVFLSLSTMAAHVAAFGVLHDLRLRVARKLGDVPLSFFSTRTSGDLKRIAIDDVNQIEGFVAHNFPDAVAAFAVPLLTFAALLFVDWRMALGSLAVAPVAIVVMGAAMRGMEASHKTWYENQDRINNSLLEYLRGIHVIKSFGLAAARFGELKKSIDGVLQWMVTYMQRTGSSFGAFSAVIGSSVVVLMPLGGWLYLTDRLPLADLILFLVLGPQILLGLMRLMFATGNVQRIEAGNQRLIAVLDAPALKNTGTATATHNGVSFRDVKLEYGDGRLALDGLTFEARDGEITALVGPSGAGKTSIARLVPRLWEATAGTVEVGGVPVQAQPLDALLARMSVVFQDVFLFHGTVRENLKLAKADATDAQLEAACRAARALEFIAALPQGFDTLLGERGARLSGGEKQRLSIARAILKDAPILILDEATAFADAENEALIQDALAELCVGRTVLVIAHRLSSVATAHRLVVVNEGRVVDEGTHEALLSRCALYQRLWHDHQASLDWKLPGGAP